MARPADPLATYKRKRDFAKTAEPAGKVGRRRAKSRIFMVQKHDATRLHFDFRLELDGTLKSWAVTRGPSLDPDDKRLAVRTEDHPMSYATFEGTIPKGGYGGGTVMLWDRGTWEPAPGKDPRKTLAQGHLHFTLDGERMKGEWVMFRLKPRGKERGENWILRKVDDEYAGSSTGLTDTFLTSVATGRTMNEIAEGMPPRKTAAPAPKRGKSRAGSRRAGLPKFREPQKATLVDHVPAGAGWLHEMKYDGYRCLLAIGDGEARIYTRSGLDWTDRFPEIAEAARVLPGPALLDGEIVALDGEGRTSFGALQQAIGDGGRGLALFLFDALEIDGEDLTKLPTVERKARLAALLERAKPPILYADHIVGKGEQLLDAMCRAGQEGIVSKKADAPYRSGSTRAWLKVKCTTRQEFVIVGWTASDKAGRHLRNLLLAVNGEDGLRYAGKVGTGFTEADQEELAGRLAKLASDTPTVEAPRSETRGARWVKPELVAEIAFAAMTESGILRHASFIGLRSDKPAREVVAERPQPADPVAVSADVKISNPQRMLFPEVKVTKGDLADYYRAIGPAMLPWIANRPVSLVRCPQGRAKKCFFQKHDSGSFGPHVRHIPIVEKDGKAEDYLYVEDIAGIIACVQMGTIEFHGWGARTDDVERPDRIVFDLDPDAGLDFAAVRKAAKDIRRQLADMGLTTFPMLTGGKGVHVIAPLTPNAKWPEVKDFCRRFALALAEAEPERFTANLKKVERKGRIFVDYLRNQRGATAIVPYSARARDGAPVAPPINWDELDEFEGGNAFGVRDVEKLLERAASRTLAGWGLARQTLPDL
jgi:bifunctional non-homologous end joining protein LigD